MREKSVLIVDDEKRLADSLRALLAEEDYLVHVAYGGRDAGDRLRERFYHVIVTDLRMRDVDGLELIRRIARDHPRSLVIVITGHATTDSAIEALHYHVFDYLRKPFEFDLFRMAIEKAFQKIETEQLREDTAAMITHDIKIPLTSIIGFAAMIAEPAADGRLHPRAREFAATIQANGQKILDLIENYLTSCRIEAGTLAALPAPVDLERMIDDVIEGCHPEAARQGRKIVRHVDERARQADLDEVLAYRALGNLIQNALKYGAPGTPIEVRASPAPPLVSPDQAESVCIEVINETATPLQEDLGVLFERYRQADRRIRIEGAGLGLYVVRAIVDAHGGVARAEFIPPRHVRFALYFPQPLELA